MNKATKPFPKVQAFQKKSRRHVPSICSQLGGLNWPWSRHATVRLSADAAETSSQFSPCLGFPRISSQQVATECMTKWWKEFRGADGFDALTTRQLRKECTRRPEFMSFHLPFLFDVSLPAPTLANPLFRSRGIDLIGCFDKDAILQRRPWTGFPEWNGQQ